MNLNKYKPAQRRLLKRFCLSARSSEPCEFHLPLPKTNAERDKILFELTACRDGTSSCSYRDMVATRLKRSQATISCHFGCKTWARKQRTRKSATTTSYPSSFWYVPRLKSKYSPKQRRFISNCLNKARRTATSVLHEYFATRILRRNPADVITSRGYAGNFTHSPKVTHESMSRQGEFTPLKYVLKSVVRNQRKEFSILLADTNRVKLIHSRAVTITKEFDYEKAMNSSSLNTKYFYYGLIDCEVNTKATIVHSETNGNLGEPLPMRSTRFDKVLAMRTAYIVRHLLRTLRKQMYQSTDSVIKCNSRLGSVNHTPPPQSLATNCVLACAVGG